MLDLLKTWAMPCHTNIKSYTKMRSCTTILLCYQSNDLSSTSAPNMGKTPSDHLILGHRQIVYITKSLNTMTNNLMELRIVYNSRIRFTFDLPLLRIFEEFGKETGKIWSWYWDIRERNNISKINHRVQQAGDFCWLWLWNALKRRFLRLRYGFNRRKNRDCCLSVQKTIHFNPQNYIVLQTKLAPLNLE